MLDIRKRIDLINQLLSQDSIASLTYAALEARLTIEHLFFERLISSQAYYAKSDIAKWNAAQAVREVSREANELIDQGISIYISKFPNDPTNPPTTEEDFEALDWLKLGDQAAMKVRTLSSIHQALSKHALHIHLPREGETLSIYGDAAIIRKKVHEALQQFDSLQHGTLLAGSLLGEYSFACEVCGAKIRRKAELLKNGQVLRCFNEACIETYQVHVEETRVLHSRRLLAIHCTKCKATTEIPTRRVENLRLGEIFHIECNCGADIAVGLVPQSRQEKVSASE